MAVNATASLYDMINVTEGGDILQFIQGVNEITGDWFMLLVLIAGWIILFVSMKSSVVDNQDAFVASGFITAVLAIFFVTLDFIRWNIMVLIVMVAAAGIAFIAIKRT